MKIAFSGHRDQVADEADLHAVFWQWEGATWMHGGARGFDDQVKSVAERLGAPVIVYRPDYSKGSKKSAPIRRNVAMLTQADLLVALYDGRTTGGTYFCVEEARRRKLQIIFLRFAPRTQPSPAPPASAGQHSAGDPGSPPTSPAPSAGGDRGPSPIPPGSPRVKPSRARPGGRSHSGDPPPRSSAPTPARAPTTAASKRPVHKS